MFKIFRNPLIMSNLAKMFLTRKKDTDLLVWGMQFSDHFDYEDTFYKVGPDMCAIEPAEKEGEIQYEFYISLNLPVDLSESDPSSYADVDRLVVKDALNTRIKCEEKDYFEVEQEVRKYIRETYNFIVSNKTYFLSVSNGKVNDKVTAASKSYGEKTKNKLKDSGFGTVKYGVDAGLEGAMLTFIQNGVPVISSSDAEYRWLGIVK